VDKFPLGGGFIYQHGGYKAFNISDPKPRNIHKASVRDRVLHHAIYRQLYPFFDWTFIADSFLGFTSHGNAYELGQEIGNWHSLWKEG